MRKLSNTLIVILLIVFSAINIVCSQTNKPTKENNPKGKADSVNISFDYKSLQIDEAIIANAFFEALSDSVISDLLVRNVRIRINLVVDNQGNVINVDKPRSDSGFRDVDFLKVEKWLSKNEFRFVICYEQPYSDWKKSYDLIVSTSDGIKSNRNRIFAGFPGDLFMTYDSKSDDTIQNKLDFLKIRVHELLYSESSSEK